MHKDHQQVGAAHKIRQAALIWRPVSRQMRHCLTENVLAHRIISGMIAGGVIKRDRGAVKPGHLMLEEVRPLSPQNIGVGRQAHDFIAGEADELRRLIPFLNHGINLAEGRFMQRARHT